MEALCVIEGKSIFPFLPGSGDMVGSMSNLESGGLLPEGYL